MMNVNGPGAQVLQVTSSAAELRRRGVDLSSGATLRARVVAVDGDRAVVNVNGWNITTSTTVQLREGQLVQLQVDTSDQDAVALRLVEVAPRSRVTPDLPPDAITPRSAEDIARAIRGAGLPVDDLTMTAARALLQRGLSLSRSNLDFVVKNLERFPMETPVLSDILATARSLGLPASRDAITLISAARGLGAEGLAQRLDSAAALASRVQRSLPQMDAARAPVVAEAEAQLFSALSAALVQSEPEGADLAIAQRISAILAAMRFGGLLDIGAHATTSVADALSSAPAQQASALGSELNAALLKLSATLDATIASLLGFLTGQPTEGRMAQQMLDLQAAVQPHLSAVPEGAMTRDQALTLLSALRESLEGFVATHAPLAVADVPLPLRTLVPMLNELPDRMLSRVNSAISAIEGDLPSEADAAVNRLVDAVQAVLQRTAQHPADRVTALLTAVVRTLDDLGPLAARSPVVRALMVQLREIEGVLTGPGATSEPAATFDGVVRHLVGALQGFRQASEDRIGQFVARLAGRAESDLSSVTAQLSSAFARYTAQALARAQVMTLPSTLSASPGLLLPGEAIELLQMVNASLGRAGGAFDAFFGEAREALGRADGSLAEALRQVLSEVPARAPRSPDMTLRLLAHLEVMRGDARAEAVLEPRVLPAAENLRAAITLDAVRALAQGSAELTRALETASAHPQAGADRLQDDLRSLMEMVGRSLEHKLLHGDSRASHSDLRAVLGRLEHALARLSGADDASTLGEQAQQLLATVASARQVLEGQQLLNAVQPRPTIPSHVFVEIPVVVDGHRLEAHLKVRRDGEGGRPVVDEDNARVALKLHTRNLGTVTALLAMQMGRLSVEFAVDDAASADFLRVGLVELGEALSRAGLDVDRIMAMPRVVNEPDSFDRLGEPAYEPYTLSILA